MTVQPNPTVLKATRGVIWVIMALVSVTGIILALVSAVLPFYWAEAIAGIAKEHPISNADGLMTQVYVIIALAIVALGLGWTIMRKLLAMIETVANGNPFILANAARLKAIGWMMVAANIVAFPMLWMADQIARRFGEGHVDGDLSLTGLLSILLVFVLAGVFEQGAIMREELEGTV